MPSRRRRKSVNTENLHVRISPAEKEALWQAADLYDVDISEIIRGWIHSNLPVRPDPSSNVRQFPLIGAHLAEVKPLPQQPVQESPSATAKRCRGRQSNPEYVCTYLAYADYDQCRGCAIADVELRQQRNANAQRKTGTKLY